MTTIEAARPETLTPRQQQILGVLLTAHAASGEDGATTPEVEERCIEQGLDPSVADAVLAELQELGFASAGEWGASTDRRGWTVLWPADAAEGFRDPSAAAGESSFHVLLLSRIASRLARLSERAFLLAHNPLLPAALRSQLGDLADDVADVILATLTQEDLDCSEPELPRRPQH